MGVSTHSPLQGHTEAVVTTDHPTEVNTRSRVNIARCRLGTIGGRTYTAELGLLTKLIYLIGFTLSGLT